ncbi:hypothetical protein F503_05641 [Ophiostoma piceae UAMH 11346]|uniref:Uncharacterized protein n=1 Tax=Ophiostoma piceae (strain UAMH 11346) TaxID=1262450 RepID=S3CEM3_OPHP1|nr:hypothetical protein F503_05641 [Ophiostoma piceae UAMH 11346]
MTDRDGAQEHIATQGKGSADYQEYTDDEDQTKDQLSEMASLQHQRQPWTPVSTRSRRRLSVLPTPPSSGANQRLRLRRQDPPTASQTQPTRALSPTPAPAPEQLPHAPSPPPLRRQSLPQTAVPNTPRISREESPDVLPLPHGQQFCSCCRRRPDQTDQTGQGHVQTEQEATDGTSTCAVHSTQSRGSSRSSQGSGSQTGSLDSQGSKSGGHADRHSRESDSLSKMDSQLRDARKHMERRRQYQ